MDGSLFAASETVVIRDDSNRETGTIDSMASNTLTMVDDLTNDYTTAANAFVKNTTDSTNLSNFPVLISLTDNRLKYAASGDPEHVRQTDGGDFVFTDNLNSVILHHELERYDSTAERVERNNPERGSQDER